MGSKNATKTLLKGDLVSRLHDAFPEHFKKDLENVAAVVFDSITNVLKDGGRIELRGLGSFAVHQQKGRKFINPRNHKLISCPSSRRILFRPGKDLTDRKT